MHLDDVCIVVDEDLVLLGRALSLLRDDVAVSGEPPIDGLLPRGAKDSERIPVVGDRGWLLITADRRLRTRPGEATLAVAHHLRAVHLFGLGDHSPWEQAVRLLSRWATIEGRLAAQSRGAIWLSARPRGLRLMRYEPGRPS